MKVSSKRLSAITSSIFLLTAFQVNADIIKFDFNDSGVLKGFFTFDEHQPQVLLDNTLNFDSSIFGGNTIIPITPTAGGGVVTTPAYEMVTGYHYVYLNEFTGEYSVEYPDYYYQLSPEEQFIYNKLKTDIVQEWTQIPESTTIEPTYWNTYSTYFSTNYYELPNIVDENGDGFVHLSLVHLTIDYKFDTSSIPSSETWELKSPFYEFATYESVCYKGCTGLEDNLGRIYLNQQPTIVASRLPQISIPQPDPNSNAPVEISVNSNQSTTLSDVVNINGSLNLNGNNEGAAYLTLNGPTTLSGSGSTVLGGNGNNIINANGSTSTLTIDTDHTLTGSGTANLSGGLVNNGTIIADGNNGLNIQTNGQSFVNNGDIQVSGGSSLTSSNQITQSGQNALINVNGTLNAPLDLQAGFLNGSGTINGNVVVDAGTVAPGNSPGHLTINGDYTMGSNSVLNIEAFGLEQGISYDWLSITGTANLNGTLNFIFGNGFTANVGDTFNFLTANSISGSFNQILANGYSFEVLYGAQGASLTVTGITNVAAVPEPETYAMMGLGLLALVGMRRRRQDEV